MPFVCTTAIWSSKKDSFLGVICHWVDEQSLQRKSIAIACSGIHPFDKIADMLDDINKSEAKLIGSVTDNGWNFIKAFKEFGINLHGDILFKIGLNEEQIEFDEETTSDSSELNDDTASINNR